MEVIGSIPIELDAGELLRTLRVGMLKDSDMPSLIEECHRLSEPKAVCTFLKVTGIEKDEVGLESGHTLKSIILADMLECGQTIVPYVVTIGPNLEKQASENAKDSVLRAWVMERIGDYALGKALNHIKSHVQKTLGSAVSGFSPGTGTGKLFGIEQQEKLFQILDPPKSIGVNLTPSYLMIPRKSVSGVFAATRREYVACQYRPREKCENRRNPFSGEYVSTNCERRTH